MLIGKKYTPEDIVRMVRRRAWLILVPFAIVSALTALAARRLPERYQSETVILVVPQRVPDTYVKSTVTARIEDRLESISQQILSRTRLERIILDFNLYPVERSTRIMEDVVEKMRGDISVQVVKGDAFRVRYSGANARTVMKVTDRLASLFIEENLRDREVMAEGTSQFLEAQLEDARRRLIEQEKKIEQYRRRYSGQLPSQLESNLQIIQNLQLQIQMLTEALNRDRERRLIAERALADLEAPASTSSADAATGGSDAAPRTMTAAEQLEAARAELRAMQGRLKPAHPDMVRAALLIEELQRKADAEALVVDAERQPADARARNRAKAVRAELEQLDREIARKEAQEAELRAAVIEYQRRVEAIPTRESEMAELTRDYATLQSMYTTLLTKREDSKIAANLERRQIGEQFKLLDPARLPERPYSPNRLLIALFGLGTGLLIGLTLAGIVEYRDSTFETDEDVAQTLAVSVLAVVPVAYSVREHRRAVIRRLAVACSLGAIVAGSFAVFAYTFVL